MTNCLITEIKRKHIRMGELCIYPAQKHYNMSQPVLKAGLSDFPPFFKMSYAQKNKVESQCDK